MFHCGMRQVEERHVANQVDLLIWSQRLDLVALSNFKGEIQIHRLGWQKVWSLPPPKENNVVRAMAWRPDGKALAIGYDSGCVIIVNIENKEILDKFFVSEEVQEEFPNQNECDVTYISWVSKAGTMQNVSEYNQYEDASIYLMKPPPFVMTYKNSNGDDNIKDLKDNPDPNQLNILIIGYGKGSIHMSILGRFPFCTIHLAEMLKYEYGDYKILDINLADDFSAIHVMYLEKSSNVVFTAALNTSVLTAFSEEVFIVANRHLHIAQLMTHLEQTMTAIMEAWENIILEMDAKMAEYAFSVPEGAVSADFLELLMMGVPSDELELFLLQDLTTKGLKKFGNSVELSYSTIQKLVLRHLNVVGQGLTYHFAELRGLARIPDRYKILGLDEVTITAAIKSSCGFLSKCLELQQVIDISMRNYKAFFRWLYTVIVRLLDEQAPTDILKGTQQDLNHIAEFLYNFDSVKVEGTDRLTRPVRFNLERLSQYLQDHELTIPVDDEDNPWQQFINENPCLMKENDTIFPMQEFRKFSLVQQQKHLKNAVSHVFDYAGKEFLNQFSILHNLKCYDDKALPKSLNNFRTSQIYDAVQSKFFVALLHTPSGKDGFGFVSLNVSTGPTAVKYFFSDLFNENNESEKENMEVLDVQFYSTEYLSIILQHTKKHDSTVFVQLPVKIAMDHSVECNVKTKVSLFSDNIARVDLSPLLDQTVYKVLEKMDGFRVAVSGGRKVAMVLSKSRRKVRVFEMEVGADDEEETDITPQSHNTTQQSDNLETVDRGDASSEENVAL